jgi:hypothetical protein
MKTFQEKPQENELVKLGLRKGINISIIKTHSTGGSSVSIGAESRGRLVDDVSIGHSLKLDSGAQTTTVIDSKIVDGRIYVKTQTSVYKIVVQEAHSTARITDIDLEKELLDFSRKGYGEWDMMTNKVPFEDNPYVIVLDKIGIKEDDAVEFFAEKVRSGRVVRVSDGYTIRDSNSNPWGIAGILKGKNGYIKKA